jgi:phosphoserine phosphatase
MRHLVQALRDRRFDVFVVSGSNVWTVRAAVDELGIDAGHVLAIEAAVEGGTLRNELLEPITWAQGKADAILRLMGRRPVFAAGDSSGDIPMLCLATREALVVGCRGNDRQKRLRWYADRKGWIWVDMP